MQIQRMDYESFTFWRRQIEDLFDISAMINFPGYAVDAHYGKAKCEEVAAYLKDGTAIVLVAIDGKKLMGWVWCHQIYRMNKKRLHIAEIAVVDAYHRQGVGSRLLAKIEQYANENGYQEIELFVTASNINAVKFYEKSSFIPERYLMEKSVMTEPDTRNEGE